MNNLEKYFAAARAVEVPLSQDWLDLLAQIEQEDQSAGMEPEMPSNNDDQFQLEQVAQ